jgi:hypothetical protein
MSSGDKEVKKELDLASCRTTTFMHSERATNVNGYNLHDLYQVPKADIKDISVANPVGKNDQLKCQSKETMLLSMRKDTEEPSVSNFGMKVMFVTKFPNLHFMLSVRR